MLCPETRNETEYEFRIAVIGLSNAYLEEYAKDVKLKKALRSTTVEILLFLFRNIRCDLIDMMKGVVEGNLTLEQERERLRHALRTNTADMSFYFVGVSSEVFRVFRLSNSIQTQHASVFSAYKEPLVKLGFTSVAVFSAKIWLAVCLLLILVSRFSSSLQQKPFLMTIFVFFGALFGKSQPKQQGIYSNRMLFIGWVIGALFIASLYGARLPSHFITTVNYNLNNLDDILSQDINPMLDKNSPITRHFLEPELEYVFDEFAKKVKSTKGLLTFEEIVTRQNELISGKAAFFDAICNLYGLAIAVSPAANNTKFHVGKKSYFPFPVMYLLQRNISVWKMEIVNKRIARYVETSQGTRPAIEDSREYRHFLASEEKAGFEFSPISFRDAEMSFLIWFISLAFSLLVLIIEITLNLPVIARILPNQLLNMIA